MSSIQSTIHQFQPLSHHYGHPNHHHHICNPSSASLPPLMAIITAQQRRFLSSPPCTRSSEFLSAPTSSKPLFNPSFAASAQHYLAAILVAPWPKSPAIQGSPPHFHHTAQNPVPSSRRCSSPWQPIKPEPLQQTPSILIAPRAVLDFHLRSTSKSIKECL